MGSCKEVKYIYLEPLCSTEGLMWSRGWPLRSVLTGGAGGRILTIIFILYIWSFGNSCYSPLPPGMDLFLCRPSSRAWSFSRGIIANIILTASLPPLINKTPQTVQLGILSPQSSKSDQVHFQWQLHPLSTGPLLALPMPAHHVPGRLLCLHQSSPRRGLLPKISFPNAQLPLLLLLST